MARNPFLLYYSKQAQTGAGIPVFEGDRYQRGYGFREWISPLLPVLKNVGKSLLSTGVDVGRDVVMEGTPFRESIKRRGPRAAQTIASRFGVTTLDVKPSRRFMKSASKRTIRYQTRRIHGLHIRVKAELKNKDVVGVISTWIKDVATTVQPLPAIRNDQLGNILRAADINYINLGRGAYAVPPLKSLEGDFICKRHVHGLSSAKMHCAQDKVRKYWRYCTAELKRLATEELDRFKNLVISNDLPFVVSDFSHVLTYFPPPE